MFVVKPSKLTLTLVFYITLALVLATFSEAKGHASVPAHRAHLNRLIRQRSPSPQSQKVDTGNDHNILGGINASNAGPAIGAASPPPSESGSASSSVSAEVTSNFSTQTTASTSLPVTSSTSDLSSSASSTTSSLSSLSSSSSSSTTSSSSSSSASSTSSSSISSAPTTTPPPPPSTSQTLNLSPLPTSDPVAASKSTITLVSSASAASETASAAPTSATKITHTTITVIIVIASCIGGTALIWTIIRKWKFRPSSQFEDRMQPIDWQPTSAENTGLPTHRRANSNASSFHSGASHDGYGTTSNHSHGVSSLNRLPDHDFTAGPGGLNPVGGYADLARGPSPQPYMQEALTRGPSLTRPNYDQHGIPLHHQGGYGAHDAYDYNGGPRY